MGDVFSANLERNVFSSHSYNPGIYPLCKKERERARERGCNETFYVKRKQSGSVLCAAHAIRGKQMGEGSEREMVKANGNNGLSRSRLFDYYYVQITVVLNLAKWQKN